MPSLGKYHKNMVLLVTKQLPFYLTQVELSFMSSFTRSFVHLFINSRVSVQ